MAKANANTMATIDEALKRTNFGLFNYWLAVFAGMVLANINMESIGISFALPVLECDMNLTYKQQGLLAAVSFMGIIISAHLWGFLGDTIGRKRIMQPALLIGFVITLCSAFATSFEILAILRFLSGVFLSAGTATVFVYLGEFHCQEYRNRAILAGAYISGLLAILFPVVAWVFINQTWELNMPWLGITFTPWRSYIIACGSLGLVCGVMLFFLPESPKYLMTMGRTDEAIDVIKRVHNINIRGKTNHSTFNVTTLIADADTPIKSQPIDASTKNVVLAVFQSMWQQTAPLFMRDHIRKTTLASVIQFIIFYSAQGVYMWFPHILNSTSQFTNVDPTPMRLCDILRITQTENFTINNNNNELEICSTQLDTSTYKHTIAFELVYFACLICASYTIGKVGRKTMLFIIMLICGVCGILALLIKIPTVAIYFFVVMLCCCLATVVLNAIVVDIYPTNLRAMAVCISLMSGRLGNVVASNVLGAFLDVNCEAVLYSASASLIFGGLLGFLLPKSNILPKKLEAYEEQ